MKNRTRMVVVKVGRAHRPVRMHLNATEYREGGRAVSLTVAEDYTDDGGQLVEQGELFCVLSVFLYQSTPELPDDACWYGKHWDGQAEYLDQLIKAGLIVLAYAVPPAVAGYVPNVQAFYLADEQPSGNEGGFAVRVATVQKQLAGHIDLQVLMIIAFVALGLGAMARVLLFRM